MVERGWKKSGWSEAMGYGKNKRRTRHLYLKHRSPRGHHGRPSSRHQLFPQPCVRRSSHWFDLEISFSRDAMRITRLDQYIFSTIRGQPQQQVRMCHSNIQLEANHHAAYRYRPEKRLVTLTSFSIENAKSVTRFPDCTPT